MQLGRLIKNFLSGKTPWKQKYKVGKYTYGEPVIHHWGEPFTLEVGNFCSIAGNVEIFLGGNHRVDWISTFPFPVFWESAKHFTGQSVSKGHVKIGNDVWIGAGAKILSGVNIGDGAVIGASAVITKDVPDYAIVAGNPAKVVRMRFDASQISTLKRLRWWEWKKPKIEAGMEFILSNNITGLENFSSLFDKD